jgi:hypothetical protein
LKTPVISNQMIVSKETAPSFRRWIMGEWESHISIENKNTKGDYLFVYWTVWNDQQ